MNVLYQTYSLDDYTNFIKLYSGLANPPDWFMHDFGKPNDTISQHGEFGTLLQSAWVQTVSSTLWLELTLQKTGAVAYGSPDVLWLSLAVPKAEPLATGLNLTVMVFNKTSTRLPEAMFLGFHPANTSWAQMVSGWSCGCHHRCLYFQLC